MTLKLFVFTLLLLGAVNCEESEQNEVDPTIILSDENFESTIGTNNFFVMFFAPW